MTKLLVLASSPRPKGNSTILATEAARGAKDAGAESYRPLKGKRVGIILTYGDADPFVSGAVNAIRAFQDAFAYVGAPIAGMVYGSADKPGEVRANKTLMKNAYALGQKLGF